MAGCITSDYKEILLGLMKAETENAVVEAVIKTIPLCSPAKPAASIKPERASAELWPSANYYDKDGTVKTGSFSGLFKEIYGVPVTQDTICRWWGDQQECRSPSTVENFRNRGAIVKGNGEPAPTPSTDMSAAQVEKLYKNWKDYLLVENKKIHIYHPEHPDIMQATETAKKTAKK